MRKILVSVSIMALLIACATTPSEKPGSLNEAIDQTSKTIQKTIETKTRVAVLNISSPSQNISQYIIDELSASLINENITVVDRQESELIVTERNYQLSGEISDETALGMGKTLGVQLIITGSLIEVDHGFRLRTKMLNVETREIEASISVDIKRSDRQINYLW